MAWSTLVVWIGVVSCGRPQGSAPSGSGSAEAGLPVASAPAGSGGAALGSGQGRATIGTMTSKVAAPIANPASLANRWLVTVRRGDAAGLEQLASHPDLSLTPLRVPSSAFRDLVPCEDLVAAASFVARDEAIALQRRLDALSLPTDVVFTGAYVGRRPRLESWCDGARAEVTATCGDVRFVERHGDASFLVLGLDAAATASAVAGAPAAAPGAGGNWVSKLDALEVGGVKVGDAWTGMSAEGVATPCTVDGFVALTRTVGDAVPCGGPSVLASLSCRGDGNQFALAPHTAEPVRWIKGGKPKPAALAAAMVAVTSSRAFLDARGAIGRLAEARRGAVDEAFEVDVVRAGDTVGMLVVATLSTGPKGAGCSAEGDQRTVVGVVNATGGELTTFQDLGAGTVDGVFDLDGDGRPELLQNTWPSLRAWRGSDGAVRCAAAPPVCKNPC